MAGFNQGLEKVSNLLSNPGNGQLRDIRPGPEEMNSGKLLQVIRAAFEAFPALSLMDESRRKIFFAVKKKGDLDNRPVEALAIHYLVLPKITQNCI